jgi:hypothetical protein
LDLDTAPAHLYRWQAPQSIYPGNLRGVAVAAASTCWLISFSYDDRLQRRCRRSILFDAFCVGFWTRSLSTLFGSGPKPSTVATVDRKKRAATGEGIDNLARDGDGAAGCSVASGGEEWYLGFRVLVVGFRCRCCPTFVLRVRGARVTRVGGAGRV